jgi:sporulation protein YlmC with PRC-barrel domain
MKKHSITAMAFLAASALTGAALAQSDSAADPACLIKNADGSNAVDRTKCPDGMKPTASGTGAEATTDQTSSSEGESTTAVPEAAATGNLIVPADRFQNAKVMAASDFIGKRVYTQNGDDIGEVTDLIVTDNGAVQAVILGVGGFLGIGEKDVAVTMQSIRMQPEGESTRLVVDASKEQLTNAPDYDRAKRTYLN